MYRLPYTIAMVYRQFLGGWVLDQDQYGYIWVAAGWSPEALDPLMYEEDAFVERYKTI